ncbi:MAG: CRISPR-associated protein Csx19 [Caldilineaceae bacterium]
MSQSSLNLPIETFTPPADFDGDLRAWLQQEAQKRKLPWLLAHSDDGVNWGKIEKNRLLISHDYFATLAPPLRTATLQQARLFGSAGELLLWQVDGQWRGRFLAADPNAESVTMRYLLWGDRSEGKKEGFVLLADGAEGLRHAPPLPAETTFDPKTQHICLQVQHYINYDKDGQAYIASSRLVTIDVVAQKEER